MIDYTDHKQVIALLAKDQEADHDNRERAREAHLFLDKRDGQWEPYWWNANAGKPRYTFDMCNPVVDQIAGEMEQNEFDIEITPKSGDATKETAKLFGGLVRNIEALSGAVDTYNQAGRSMVTGGLDGWRVVQKYVDDDCFDQDLVIEKVANFLDRVWIDSTAEKRDRSDAKHGFVMQGMSPEEYKKRWPKGSEQSVESDREGNAYWQKADLVIVGELYYIKEVDRELVLMDNGRVYEADEKFEAIREELAALGIKEEKRRTRKKRLVCHRLFDGKGWLSESKETVFGYIPIVPTFANYKVFENKTIYWGAVEKLMDEQRVLNYAMSREIEEGALAPRAKYWMTPEQVRGHTGKLATLNTNSDPVQLFNPDPANPGVPQQNGGAQINPGLRAISESMVGFIGKTAGLFAANMGDNPGLQSGVAIERLQHKGDNGTIKYFKAQETAIAHTGRILIDAIPKVYNSRRQARILKEDGSFDMVELNQEVMDTQTGQPVVLNDLSAGKYDVSCTAGPAFQSRQQEAVAAMVELGGIDPAIIQIGDDVLAGNINAPGMDTISERLRLQKFQAGLIPPSQWTDEEKQQVQQQQAQAQQNQQPDPAMLIGQAELMKAQTEQGKAGQELQIKAGELQLRARKQQSDEMKMMLEQQNQQAEQLKLIAETMKAIREALGADAVVSPAAAQAFDKTAQRLNNQS